MLKSLFATCLTALSVNTQPLPVSRSIEPSLALENNIILPNTTYIISLDNTSIFDDYIFIPYDRTNNNFVLVSFETDLPYYINGFSDFLINETPFYHSYLYIYPDDVFSIDFEYGSNQSTFSFLCDYATLDTFDSFHINILFRTLTNPTGTFNNDILNYVSIYDEHPYTPPAKSNLYRLLYDFYYSIFNDDDLTAISTGYNMPFDNWLAHTCTIATLFTLIVVAFFFLRWLFKVISGLILLKH